MADLNLKAGTNMSIRQEDTDLYLDNTYEYDDTEIQQDLLTRSLITETGNKIELTLNNTTYKMTAILKDKYNNIISTSNEIDLPIESLVVSIYYDSTTKELVFVLKDGTTTRVPLLDLIDGLATEEDLQTLEDNVNDTIQTFEDDINEDMETFKGDVEQELEKAQQELNQYKMLENALPKVEGEGETIHLEDTAKCPMKLGFKGQIQQASTTGKNLCETGASSGTTSNVAFAINSDGSVKANGTASAEINKNITTGEHLDLDPNKSYFLSGSPSSASSTTYRLMGACILQDNSTTYIADNTGNGVAIPATTKNIRVYINVKSGKAINGTFYPMVEESNIKTDWEPYTGNSPSPSPSYPQDVHVVSGDNTIKVCNKNLWDKGEDFTINSTSSTWYFINGAKNAYGSNIGSKTTYKYLLQSGKTYYMQWYIDGTVYASSPVWSNESTTGITRLSGGSTTGLFVYEIVGKDDYIVPRFSVTDGTTIRITNVQLEENNDSYTSFAPHQEYTKAINLPVENLFDKDNATYKNGYYINTSGVETTTGQSGYTTSYVKVRPNTTYTLSGKIKPIDLISGVYFYDNTKNWLERINWVANTTENYFTFITPPNCYYIQFQYNLGEYNANTIQICEGTTKTYYPFRTAPIEVCKIGTYEDEFFKNTIDSEYYDGTLELDKWYLKKRIGKVVLDGTQSISIPGTTVGTGLTAFKISMLDILDTYDYALSYSNLFLFTARNFNQWNETQKNTPNTAVLAAASNVSNIYFRVYSSLASTTTDMNNYLSSNNLIIYYIKRTPTNILLNDTLQETLDSFYSYQEQTNISQENNDIPFIIKASAIYDLTNLVNRVATLETE